MYTSKGHVAKTGGGVGWSSDQERLCFVDKSIKNAGMVQLSRTRKNDLQFLAD